MHPSQSSNTSETITAEALMTPSSWSRRRFLHATGLALLSVATAPMFLHRTAWAGGASEGHKRRVLVVVFQRGAVDGLSMVVPYQEAEYYRLRPTIALPSPGKNGGCVDLDGAFGMHPSLAPLAALYKQGSLAVVHASGSPNPTRSHFDAQDFMETGCPGGKVPSDGWLNRCLALQPISGEATFRGVACTSNLPRSLQGKVATLAIARLDQFGVRNADANIEQRLESMYALTGNTLLKNTGRESFEAEQELRRKTSGPYKPEHGAQYGTSGFATQMQQAARLIKADVGAQIVCTDIGGWDTHTNQGASTGALAGRLNDLATNLEAFVRDLGPHMENVLVLTMSEFGRQVRENGSGGTDHGHGNVNLVLGGPVQGGRVYGTWPGLGRHQLFEERDLAVTTDFRDVFGEVALRHLGGEAGADRIFPGYDLRTRPLCGFVRA